jgi:hypothetical protein
MKFATYDTGIPIQYTDLPSTILIAAKAAGKVRMWQK